MNRLASPIWVTLKHCNLTVIIGKKQLSVAVAEVRPRHYLVMALEAPLGATKTADAFLEHHAHKVLAEDVKTLREAKGIAETYVHERQRGKKSAMRCKCPEIKK